MANKVKPFYIRITDDMTPQMIQDAFDKCVDAGAVEGDCVDGATSKHEYQDGYEFGVYKLFGVSEAGYARLYNTEAWFGSNAQEITLDQLDEWLGLEVKQEWKNGDECVISTKSKSKWFVVGTSPITETSTVCISNTGELKSFHTHHLKKPETPEQKAEREKKEEVKEMIQCLLDNYTECDDSAIEYVIDYLKECESLGR